MAKIQYSALVNSMSGKLNGSVMSFNKGGSYVRNKGIVANPNTLSQQNVRGRFGQASSSFKSLTTAQVAAWHALAASRTYTNIFGEAKTLSALQWFVRLNANLAAIGQPSITDAPTLVTELDVYSILAEYKSVDGYLTVETRTTMSPSNWLPVVSFTPQTRPSVTNVNNTYRIVENGAIVTSGVDPYIQENPIPAASYAAVFGPLSETGGNVKVRCYFVNKTTGQSTQVFGQDVVLTFP